MRWDLIDRNIREMVGDLWAMPTAPGTEETDKGNASRPRLQVVGEEKPAKRETMCFETLVVRASNRTAVNMAKRIAEGGDIPARVIVIYGEPGTGKTHILKSIEAAYARHNSEGRLTYLAAEEFMTRFVKDSRAGDTSELQAFVKHNDLLLIDDLHWIAGKRKTDKAFFGAVRAVTSAGGYVVITADTSPGDMVGLSRELA
ncbi:MAG: DnaA/Hda family protein, partial [Pseudomonadota bacterium]